MKRSRTFCCVYSNSEESCALIPRSVKCPEMTHITSTHNSLARASQLTALDYEGARKCWKGRDMNFRGQQDECP